MESTNLLMNQKKEKVMKEKDVSPRKYVSVFLVENQDQKDQEDRKDQEDAEDLTDAEDQ